MCLCLSARPCLDTRQKPRVGTMSNSCCGRHDDQAVLLTTAQAGQSTTRNPDLDTEGDIGVDSATDTLEVGDVQSVKCVEKILRLPSGQLRKSPCPTELWKRRETSLEVVGWRSSSDVRGVIRREDERFWCGVHPNSCGTMLEEEHAPRNSGTSETKDRRRGRGLEKRAGTFPSHVGDQQR